MMCLKVMDVFMEVAGEQEVVMCMFVPADCVPVPHMRACLIPCNNQEYSNAPLSTTLQIVTNTPVP